MAVFKKLRKNKDKSLPLPEPEAVKPLDKRVGIESYRHYRSVDENKLNSNWRTFYNGGLTETRLEENFEKRLTSAVMERVKYVYDRRMIRCEEIAPATFKRFERRLLDCAFKNESQTL
ncbi:Protein CBG22405 [Caenorhabditis briggsae]|uniref:Protein CBG22405 n=1 Tax=Caenorhabditis briggsae TaxID=6238 RepID=H8WH76_CAEBR|nr:Protein CBG22405 [Caenorhabditis briggsae]CCG58534.1 Protein CBG22405 [Caenorhabditis briggsae]